MTLLFFKSETNDDYNWHISVSKEDNSEKRIYKIMYTVKGCTLLNLNEILVATDSMIYEKKKRIIDPVKHLMAATPVCSACCASFRNEVVDLFAQDELISSE
jgi:hypothetical protein